MRVRIGIGILTKLTKDSNSKIGCEYSSNALLWRARKIETEQSKTELKWTEEKPSNRHNTHCVVKHIDICNRYDQFDSHRFALNQRNTQTEKEIMKICSHTYRRAGVRTNHGGNVGFCFIVCTIWYQCKPNKQKWYLIHFFLF